MKMRFSFTERIFKKFSLEFDAWNKMNYFSKIHSMMKTFRNSNFWTSVAKAKIWIKFSQNSVDPIMKFDRFAPLELARPSVSILFLVVL